MKIILFIAFLVTSTAAFLGCQKPHEETVLDAADARARVFSLIVHNDHYMREFMDTAMHNPQAHMAMMKDHDMMMTMMKSMMESDPNMHRSMMGQMMSMAEKDSSLRNSMMDQMMTMAENNSSMCKDMMQMMLGKPNLTKEMTKAAEGVQDNLEHSKHHPPVDKK